ncbi:Protein of unknown function [Bacillus wiedmannii]|uniref:Uncharacterized protein n=1 Tax=Bacillus wiedmannii TaxID=1890302 RepID=A0AB37YTF9_9BACI|nr:Protein of unknown function [Bacillus wiedmannii]
MTGKLGRGYRKRVASL